MGINFTEMCIVIVGVEMYCTSKIEMQMWPRPHVCPMQRIPQHARINKTTGLKCCEVLRIVSAHTQ